MLIKYKKSFFPLCEEWFNESDKTILSKFKFSALKKATKKESLPFFIEEKEYTLVNDLTLDSDILFNSFSTDTKSQIRRAEKLGVAYKVNDVTLDDFLKLYNNLANKKQLMPMSKQRVVKYGLNNLTFFSAYINNKPVIINVYIHDDKICRALYSSSTIHTVEDPVERKHIGFANKFLHWKAMEYFKAQNYETYDWGGYSNDKTNKAKAGIDRFKRSFNGEVKELYSYYSVPFYLLLQIQRLLK